MADYYFINLCADGPEAETLAIQELLDAEALHASVEAFDDGRIDAHPGSLHVEFDTKSLSKAVAGATAASAALPTVEVELEYRNPNYREAGVVTIRGGVIVKHEGWQTAYLPADPHE